MSHKHEHKGERDAHTHTQTDKQAQAEKNIKHIYTNASLEHLRVHCWHFSVWHKTTLWHYGWLCNTLWQDMAVVIAITSHWHCCTWEIQRKLSNISHTQKQTFWDCLTDIQMSEQCHNNTRWTTETASDVHRENLHISKFVPANTNLCQECYLVWWDRDCTAHMNWIDWLFYTALHHCCNDDQQSQ